MRELFPSKQAAIAGYARVAVERAVDRYPDGLTYAIPSDLAPLGPGDRVIVPLGRGNTSTPGYVVDLIGTPDLEREAIKAIEARDPAAIKLPTSLIELARWIASYYCAPIGMTLATMLPAAVRHSVGLVARTMIDLGDPLPLEGKLPAKQRRVLEVLASLPADQRPIEMRALASLVELKTVGPIRRLMQRGLVEASRRSAVEAQWAEHAADSRAPQSLTGEQTQIIQAISARLSDGFSTHLIYGVTGSGKTEVYIRLIQRVLAMGRAAIVLVPEIALTPQTGGRLIGRFPKHRVAVLHSALTAAQRHQQWSLAAQGQADIVLGARSAVFAPIPDDKLGLIIVDEEHDGSYKQDQAPRYHGRDVAIRRAQLSACSVVLGSATPSLESWHNSIDDRRSPIDESPGAFDAQPRHRQSSIASRKLKYSLHCLRQRAPGLRLPKVEVVDFREQMKLRHDRHIHLLGPALETAVARTLDEGGQVLLLLNRRGYASYIACPSRVCGWIMTCDHCDVTTVYHRHPKDPSGGGYVVCHHCLAEQKLPDQCPQCGKPISTFGLGTQRVEEELSRKFPQLIEGRTMLRIDSDSMQGSRDYHQAMRRFGAGEILLLVGTQMIAKGLDFPGVRLVGVINADTSINLPDFRASERTFQLVSQVAGRCGRGSDPGLTIVQTFNAAAPAIQLAAAHDFESFAAMELAERARVGLPPITRMTRIVVRHEHLAQCITIARRLVEQLRSIIANESPGHGGTEKSNSDSPRVSAGSHGSIGMPAGGVRLRGPAPCPIARIADRHRQQIELIAPSASALHAILTKARSAELFQSSGDLAIDVDPIALL